MKNIIEKGAYWAINNDYGIPEDLNNIEDSGKIIYTDFNNQPVIIPRNMGLASFILSGTEMNIAFCSSAHDAGRKKVLFSKKPPKFIRALKML
ncbi:hypothetical protein X275_00505 [Marinitoga sp. 1197]|nr:hypothetical protein X275_00505 [Marinitoga sp. 1197]